MIDFYTSLVIYWMTNHGEAHALVVVDGVAEQLGSSGHRDPLFVPQFVYSEIS